VAREGKAWRKTCCGFDHLNVTLDVTETLIQDASISVPHRSASHPQHTHAATLRVLDI